MSLVFKHYNEALRIDPDHRGAHEYLGEAYLMVGNVAKAKEHLSVLDKLCFFPCDEFTDLKKAIATTRGSRSPDSCYRTPLRSAPEVRARAPLYARQRVANLDVHDPKS